MLRSLFRLPKLKAAAAAAQPNHKPDAEAASTSDTYCVICMDTLSDRAELRRRLRCGHQFCAECIEQLLEYAADSRVAVRCPLCRVLVLGDRRADKAQRLGQTPLEDSDNARDHDGRMALLFRCAVTLIACWLGYHTAIVILHSSAEDR